MFHGVPVDPNLSEKEKIAVVKRLLKLHSSREREQEFGLPNLEVVEDDE
jgi:hypothetical protein